MLFFIREFKRVLLGVAVADICSAVLCISLGRCGFPLLFGALFGSLFTVLKFILLMQSTANALEKPPLKAKSYMTLHYYIRFILTAAALAIAITADYLDALAVILPMASVRISLGIPIKDKEAEKWTE